MVTDPNNNTTKQNPVGRFMVAAGALTELKTTGKILIVQRSDALDWQPSEWEICYGRIDQFEDAEKGLRREMFEELGISDFEIISVLSVWHIFRGTVKAENELIGITYHCRTKMQDVQVSDEHSQFKWVFPEDALRMISIKGIRKDILKFISGRNEFR